MEIARAYDAIPGLMSAGSYTQAGLDRAIADLDGQLAEELGINPDDDGTALGGGEVFAGPTREAAESLMLEARGRLSAAEEAVNSALAELETKANGHKTAQTEFETALHSRSATVEELREKQQRVAAARGAVKDAYSVYQQQLEGLGTVREEVRDALNGPAPSYAEVIDPTNGWVQLTSFENLFHGLFWTEKFVHRDGREFIFDPNTQQLVTDSRHGTFNFAHPRERSLEHFAIDILPHIMRY